MGVWNDRVVPHLADASLRSHEVGELRARVCAGLHGRVLEIGFGSGLNTAVLPARGHGGQRGRALRRGLAALRAAARAQRRTGDALGAGRPAPRRGGRLARRRAGDLQPVHDRGPGARAAGGTPRGAARRSAPLPGARPGAGGRDAALAAAPRAGASAASPAAVTSRGTCPPCWPGRAGRRPEPGGSSRPTCPGRRSDAPGRTCPWASRPRPDRQRRPRMKLSTARTTRTMTTMMMMR